jgi:hypothetical protein
MANLIAAATAQATSADVVITTTPATFSLMDTANSTPAMPSRVCALIQIKTSGGVYLTIGQIDSDTPMKSIAAGGTYRVVKLPTKTAVGVDQT